MVRVLQVSTFALMALLLLCGSQVSEQAATFVQPQFRLPRDAQLPQPEEVCSGKTPCGWAIYKPFTRSIENYIKNTCDCPEPMKCARYDDDLSISAFVYRCRVVDMTDPDVRVG